MRCLYWAVALCVATAPLTAAPLVAYVVEDDAIAAPLTSAPGDAARGRAVVASRQIGTCVLCHAGPFPEERLPATIAPDLRGVAARLSPGQIRLRLVDSSRVNPQTVMPAYYRQDGLNRVAAAFADRPVLTAQQIEDAVAFLTTLTEP